MANGIKYSVIIPIYNAEKTLRRCLDSFFCQLRNDVQIILVNDGSQDASADIAEEYAAKNAAFQLINQKNAGVSCARNTGLRMAVGEYVTFVDSDDYVRSDYFSVLDQSEDSDLLVFCHEIVGFDPRSMPKLFEELQKLETYEQRLERLLSSRRIMSPWDKRFKRALIEEYQIRFPEGMQIGEDFNFCMAYAVRAKAIQIETAQIIFNDITGQDSLSRKYRPQLDEQMHAAFTKAAETIRNSALAEGEKARLLGIADYLFIKHIFSCISEEFKVRNLKYFKDRKEIVSICQKFRKSLSGTCCNTVHWGLRLALKWKLYFLFYFVTYWAKGRKLKT